MVNTSVTSLNALDVQQGEADHRYHHHGRTDSDVRYCGDTTSRQVEGTEHPCCPDCKVVMNALGWHCRAHLDLPPERIP